MEELLRAVDLLSNEHMLLIIGGGDILDRLKDLVATLELHDNVLFLGKLTFEAMMQYTMVADVGICIDKGTNLNYRYSLPNKVFEYIHAEIPLLVSDLPETGKLVRDHGVGTTIASHDPKEIAQAVQKVCKNKKLQRKYRENAKLAAEELCWEKEEQNLRPVYGSLQ